MKEVKMNTSQNFYSMDFLPHYLEYPVTLSFDHECTESIDPLFDLK